MNCPHCGAEFVVWKGTWECDSYRFDAGDNGVTRSSTCYSRQISQLKAELAQSVRRDDPRLKLVEAAMWNYQRNHGLSDVEREAYDHLKSIIEGK